LGRSESWRKEEGFYEEYFLAWGVSGDGDAF
jgi:hypothetical protein